MIRGVIVRLISGIFGRRDIVASRRRRHESGRGSTLGASSPGVRSTWLRLCRFNLENDGLELGDGERVQVIVKGGVIVDKFSSISSRIALRFAAEDGLDPRTRRKV
jgi:hypothetical protein